MEEGKDHYNNRQEEVFSKKVRAGKRTYFFDVKTTRSNDYYLTITESKRKQRGDDFYYEKHKIFLYKEDFTKFAHALNEVCSYIAAENGEDFSMNMLSDDSSKEESKDEFDDFISDEDGLSWD